MSEHLDHLARVYGGPPQIYDRLGESSNPVGPDHLHGMAATYLRRGDRLLDVGCRDAGHLVRLVQANEVVAAGVDPLTVHTGQAQVAVAQAGLTDRVTIVQAVAQALPFADASFDFVWCRDVIGVIDQLPEALAEIARVLSPTGCLLLYAVFATDLLEPQEAVRIHTTMGNVPANYDRDRVERLLSAAGLVVERQVEIGTQWREYEEERSQPASDALLRLARLRRCRAEIVEEFGQEEFEVEQASLHWLVYMFLGKVTPVIYVLRLVSAV